MSNDLTRPIIGIANRNAQEVFDIMCDRIQAAASPAPTDKMVGDAIDAIQRLMDEKGLKRKDLFPAKSRASECMSRKRPLSIAMIRKLHFEHGIPAEILISPYRLTEEQP